VPLSAGSRPVSSTPESASAFLGRSLSAISSPCSAFSGSPLAIASPSEVNVPFGCLNLDSKGFSPALEFSEVGSNSKVSSLGATALGEHSLPIMSESGAPIYPTESKLILRYHRRLKAKTA
jgi:hypothetical protein